MTKMEAWYTIPLLLNGVLKDVSNKERVERLVDTINMFKPVEPDDDTGLVPCGCGGKPIKTSIGAGLFTQVECPKCGIKTKLIVSGMSERSWNRAMGWEVE